MSQESETVDALLGVNSLSYAMPPSLSVATSRRDITNFPQVTSSPMGSVIIYTLNTGDGFLHGPSSYIKLTLQVATSLAGVTAFMDNIGALFTTVTVSSRSGVEICRVTEFPLYVSKYVRMKYSAAKFDRLGFPAAFDKSIVPGTALNNTVDFVMPLEFIPCFAGDQLLPPQLIEGMRIRFDLTSIAEAFRAVGGTVFSCDVQSQMSLNLTTLADAFTRRIAQVAADQGLVMLHNEVFSTIQNTAAGTLNFDIKKACSKALEFMVVTRADTYIGAAVNSQESLPYPFTSMQLQLGSVYYPNQPLTQRGAPGIFTSAEPYMYVQKGCSHNFDNNFLFEEFHSVSANKCNALFAQNLRDSSDSMSGVVLNNSRSLLVNGVYHSVVNRRVDAFLVHLRLTRIFQNNVVVRD